MSRFWGGVGILFVLGVLVALTTGPSSKIRVNDLETECRGERNVQANMQLRPDNSIRFTGYFPVENTNSNLDYDYSQNGDSVTLNIKSQKLQPPVSFWDNCLASAVYNIDSRQLEEGRYSVTIKHNDERVEKKVIRVK